MLANNIALDELKKRLQEMKPLRQTVTDIDPATTAILTRACHIKDAVNKYTNLHPNQSIEFLLIDWNGECNNDIDYCIKNTISKIYPARDCGKLSNKNICLYGNGLVDPGYSHLITISNDKIYFIDKTFHDYLSGWWTRQPCPEHIDRRINEIYRIYNNIKDEESKNVFLSAIKCIQTGNPSYLIISNFPHYFHPLCQFNSGDFVVEGGLSIGDVTNHILSQIGKNGRITGFEPLPRFYDKLKKLEDHHGNISIENCGLWSSKREFYIIDNGGQSRMVEKSLPGSKPCHVTDLDSYLFSNNLPCNAIKLDIEGAEMECLEGAKKTIAKYHPKLIISLYHHASHYMDIPVWIMDNFPDYRFHMGHHSPWYHETCLYAVYNGN